MFKKYVIDDPHTEKVRSLYCHFIESGGSVAALFHELEPVIFRQLLHKGLLRTSVHSALYRFAQIHPIESGLFGYPWCERCSMRRFILQQAGKSSYPNLHDDTGKIQCASSEGVFNWLVTVLVGTDDFVWSILLAIGNYQYTPP